MPPENAGASSFHSGTSMPRVCYEPKAFRSDTLCVIEQANQIIEAYAAQGYNLTLRQLYYQFVSRDLLPNTQQNYKRLGSIVSDARRAGLIDWSAIEDRTRNLRSLSVWDSPERIVEAVAHQFRYDLWEDQPYYVEVWFEKDALMGVFERAANELRVPFFSCRGYTSDSEVWGAAQRLKARAIAGQHPVVLHFGDHDPSGIDMTRDITDRLCLFGGSRLASALEVRRLALNMDQVEEYDPPPNPAKETDSRYANYRIEYGDESWELDALEPAVLASLVSEEVSDLLDTGAWDRALAREDETKRILRVVSDRWEDVTEYVDNL